MRLLHHQIPAATRRATTTTGTTTAIAVVPAVLRPPPPPPLPPVWRAFEPEAEELEAEVVELELEGSLPGDVDVMTTTVVWGGAVESAPVGVCVITEV